jgi:hypothetical protein
MRCLGCFKNQIKTLHTDQQKRIKKKRTEKESDEITEEDNGFIKL